jgi:putative sterol carrier protein
MTHATVKAVFQSLPAKLDPVAAEEVDAVYQFDLTGPEGGHYLVKIRDGRCVVEEGTHADPQVVFSMGSEDFVKIFSGELSGPAVMMSGRLRVTGDIGLAMQLKSLFPTVG